MEGSCCWSLLIIIIPRLRPWYWHQNQRAVLSVTHGYIYTKCSNVRVSTLYYAMWLVHDPETNQSMPSYAFNQSQPIIACHLLLKQWSTDHLIYYLCCSSNHAFTFVFINKFAWYLRIIKQLGYIICTFFVKFWRYTTLEMVILAFKVNYDNTNNFLTDGS